MLTFEYFRHKYKCPVLGFFTFWYYDIFSTFTKETSKYFETQDWAGLFEWFTMPKED